MPRDGEKFLFDVADSAQFVIEITCDESVERFKQDRIFRGAVERELQIVGEALMQLRSVDPDALSSISEHDRIIGFRHVLVHGYDSLDPEVVWFIVIEKLPTLLAEVQQLLTK